MITLILLHPLQSVPVQDWTFDKQSVVRIGRASDNDVVLYSAVVSRHHVEIRQDGQRWKVVNIGTNGTYIDDRRVDEIVVKDGLIIRIASTGPKIQIRVDDAPGDSAEDEQPVRRVSKIGANKRFKETLVNN